MEIYNLTLEDKAKLEIVETIEDLKFQREYILSLIPSNLDVKKVMNHIVLIISASNFTDMEFTTTELVERACNDVSKMSNSPIIDMGSINKENAMKNLPSSLR